MKSIREKLQSLRLFLSAHPDNIEGSEMADRLEDVEQLERRFRPLKIYYLSALEEDGNIYVNGYFLSREEAEAEKKRLDKVKINIKYGVVQTINEAQIN